MSTIIPVDLGSVPNDGTGDPLRTGGGKLNTSLANLNVDKLEQAGYAGNATDLETLANSKVASITEGTNITITGTATNPIISAVGGGGGAVEKVKVSLTASQINNIGTTPVLAIPAQGVGTVIQIISAIGKANSNTSPFDGTINLKYSGRSVPTMLFPNSLKTTDVDIILTGIYFGILEIGQNEDLTISGTDSTIVGDGTIDIYITYEITTL